MKRYECSCCSPPKSYSRSDKLSKHRQKYDRNFENYFDTLRAKTQEKRDQYAESPKKCYCGNLISYEARRSKYCSHSCSAKISNTERSTRRFCLNCATQLNHRQRKYCSHSCRGAFNAAERLASWIGVILLLSLNAMVNWHNGHGHGLESKPNMLVVNVDGAEFTQIPGEFLWRSITRMESTITMS